MRKKTRSKSPDAAPAIANATTQPADNSRRAPLTDREIARHVVNFANTGDRAAGDWLLHGYAARTTGANKSARHPEFAALVAQLHHDMQHVSRFRRAMRNGESAAEFRDFFMSLSVEANRVALYPMAQLQMLRGKRDASAVRLTVHYRLVPARLRDALSYGLFLMAADDRDCSDLCQCQRQGCGRFYLFRDVKERDRDIEHGEKPRRGKHPLKYCGPECRELARVALNSAQSAERKRVSRQAARDKAARLKQGKGRAHERTTRGKK